MIEPALLLQRILNCLPQYGYLMSDELELQQGIGEVLTRHEIPYVREFQITAADRFDFWCDDSVVIEAKCEGSMSQCLRQVDRYCALVSVKAVVIAAPLSWTRSQHQEIVLRGKPVRLVTVRRRSF